MIFLTILTFLFSSIVHAGRPLITDDADVIGDKRFQVETWVFADKRSYQHWLVPTVGIGDSVELSASVVQGTALEGPQKHTYANSGPIMQLKVALDYQLALSGGFIPPFGAGPLKTGTWDYFFYASHTLFFYTDVVLVHLNLGGQTKRLSDHTTALLWGAAVEYKTSSKSYIFVESANGDIYALIPGIAIQGGIRYNLKEKFQVDASIGRGLNGRPILPLWGTLGILWLF